jgi:hypothetical protein
VDVTSTELAELQLWFDVRQAADQMALATWRAAHPGDETPIPEHADLVIWLLDQLASYRRCDRVDQSLAKRVGAMIEQRAGFKLWLTDWLRAYATDIFPEPDLAKAADVLKAGGMTIDALSANMGRHILSCVIARLDPPDENPNN